MYRTKKLYDNRNQEKQLTHFRKDEDFYVNPREIRFTKMWLNIWFEENGKDEFKRPVLVIKKVGNMLFTVAMTSKEKDNQYFYHKISSWEFNERNQTNKDSSYVILSQVKVMDKKRFTEKMWIVGEEEFIKIKKKLKTMLF